MNYKLKLAIQYIVLAILFAIIFFIVKIPALEIQRIEYVLNAIITTSTTISGFVLTSLSILLGLSWKPIFSAIQQNHLTVELIWRYSENLIIGFLIIISCIVFGASLPTTSPIIPSIWLKTGICALIWYLVSLFFLCKYLLGVLLSAPGKITIDNTPSEPHGEYKI